MNIPVEVEDFLSDPARMAWMLGTYRLYIYGTYEEIQQQINDIEEEAQIYGDEKVLAMIEELRGAIERDTFLVVVRRNKEIDVYTYTLFLEELLVKFLREEVME